MMNVSLTSAVKPASIVKTPTSNVRRSMRSVVLVRAQNQGESVGEKAAEKYEEAKDFVKDTAKTIKESVTGAAEGTKDGAQDAADTVKEGVKEGVDSVRTAADDLGKQAQKKWDETKGEADKASAPVRRDAGEAVKDAGDQLKP